MKNWKKYLLLFAVVVTSSHLKAQKADDDRGYLVKVGDQALMILNWY